VVCEFYGCSDAFISKLNDSGSALIYSTYLGGSGGGDGANGVAVDASGNAYIVGSTNSGNFPITTGAFGSRIDLGWSAFVSKMNPTGSALIYSGCLGGSGTPSYVAGITQGYGIAIDSLGEAYVTGLTDSPGFATTAGAFQTTYSNNDETGFFSKINANGSGLMYSTYLGGTAQTQGWSVAVDPLGMAYVAGFTDSADFPTTPGALQTVKNSNTSVAFLTKLSLVTSGIPPDTYASVSGPAGNNGWYRGGVTVTLSATAGSYPVSASYYSVDRAPYKSYSAPFPISGDGARHQLLFYSTDIAGDQETPHEQTIEIDATPPVSRVAALPATASSPNFSVQWSGSDATSRLLNYTIYISDNGGPFTPWLNQTTATQAWYAGFLGHTYGFYSAAEDVAGNVEVKAVADATTHVPAQLAEDVNGDGQITCADITLVKASFGTKTGQLEFNPRADVNHDGVVNIIDLAMVSQMLIRGTTCH
jgi:hypothetical protein